MLIFNRENNFELKFVLRIPIRKGEIKIFQGERYYISGIGMNINIC